MRLKLDSHWAFPYVLGTNDGASVRITSRTRDFDLYLCRDENRLTSCCSAKLRKERPRVNEAQVLRFTCDGDEQNNDAQRNGDNAAEC